MQGRTQKIETASGRASPTPTSPGRLGKYQIIEPIGEGGFGVVYKGFDPFIKRYVAIKTCTSSDGELRQRYYREAEIAGRLDHPNIVRIFDFGTEGAMPYLVQEFLAGCDLGEKMSGHEFLPWPERLLYLIQIARGLAYAHEQGVIHRDIKPDNIRILEDGTAKIMDFGVAILLHSETRLTREGMAVGTAAYLAPEQVRGQAPDRRTDVFSFGSLAYELLTGSRPFERETISATLYSIVNDDPKPIALPPHACPGSLRQLIERCLAKDPEDRFQDFGEILDHLDDIREQGRSANERRDYDEELREISSIAMQEPQLNRGGASGKPAIDPHLGHRWKPRSVAMRRRHSWRSGAAAIAVLLVLATTYSVLGMQGYLPWPAALGRTPEAATTSTSPPTISIESTTEATKQVLNPATDVPKPVPSASRAAETATPVTSPPAVESKDPAIQSPPPDPVPVREAATLVLEVGWNPGITASVDGGEAMRLGRARSLDLDAGSHTIRFVLVTPDYRDEKTLRLDLQANEERRIEVPLGRPGLLSIQPSLGSPQGRVWIDDVALGLSPIRNHELPPGMHHLQVFAVDHPDIALADRQIEVQSNRETVITFDLTGQRELTLRQRPIPASEAR